MKTKVKESPAEERVLVLCDLGITTNRLLRNNPHCIVGLSTDDILTQGLTGKIVGIVVRSETVVDGAYLDNFNNLRFVIRAGSGVDNIDADALFQRRIQLFRNPSLSANAVAELASMSLVMLARRIPESIALLQRGIWNKSELLGENIDRLQIGVWGAGPVGLACYRLLSNTCSQIAFVSWSALPLEANHMSAEKLNKWADVHVLCLPLRSTTHHIFGDEFFRDVALRRPYIINVGRFDLVDFESLLAALRNSRLRGVFVDPIEKHHVPLVANELNREAQALNMLFSQHLGAQRNDVVAKIGEWVLDTVEQQMTS